MPKRHKLKTATLDQHFNVTLRRVRTEFERTRKIDPRFECVTDGETFHVDALAEWGRKGCGLHGAAG
jgi:hypothetical protein